MKPRVRFAPAPTGELHVGGARTALFNWLFARHHGGVFVLRIEDTDRSRSTEGGIERIMEALRWLGLDWDEYCRQTERFSLYQEAAERLLSEGKAYEQDGAWWFRVPRPGTTTVHDLLLGDVTYDHEQPQMKDFVIRRSATPGSMPEGRAQAAGTGGSFTYNFACVVDDADLKITHVIRANEHLNNTPRQILIYRALGLEPPKFAHLPMVLSKDREKLSKRHGATSVFEYRDRGILPEALLNFLARLGWSHGDQEIFSKEELIELFDLDAVGVSAAVFDEEKLLWLNQHYIINGDPDRLGELLREFLVRQGIVAREEAEALPRERLREIVILLRERSKTLVELAEKSRFIFLDHKHPRRKTTIGGSARIEPELEYEPEGVEKFFLPEKVPLLRGLIDKLSRLDGFTASQIEEAVRGYLKQEGRKLGEIAQTCRVALTGQTKGPGLFETMEVLGWESTMARLRRAIELITEEGDPNGRAS